MSNYRGMGKEKVVYTHNGIFFSDMKNKVGSAKAPASKAPAP